MNKKMIEWLADFADWEIHPVKDVGSNETIEKLIKNPNGELMFLEGIFSDPVIFPLFLQESIEGIESKSPIAKIYRVESRYSIDRAGWISSVILNGEEVFTTLFRESVTETKLIALTYIFEKEQKC